jgi:putative Holliday junction resolvase
LTNPAKLKGKTLGLDYGSVRVGVALSDETGTIAFGRKIIENKPALFNQLLELIQKEDIIEIVIGYPLNLKGQKTPQTLEVEKFECDLKEFLLKLDLNLKIVRWDERLTSKMAEASLLVSGMKKSRRQDKSNLDIISAALLLQSYLDSLK